MKPLSTTESGPESAQLGKFGEDLAAEYLEQRGYVIVERNYRRGKYEIDLIAYHEGELVVVEVKTRSSSAVGTPEQAVDHRKRQALIRLANEYVQSHRRTEEVRFDIISILPSDNGWDITHTEHAFDSICY